MSLSGMSSNCSSLQWCKVLLYLVILILIQIDWLKCWFKGSLQQESQCHITKLPKHWFIDDTVIIIISMISGNHPSDYWLKAEYAVPGEMEKGLVKVEIVVEATETMMLGLSKRLVFIHLSVAVKVGPTFFVGQNLQDTEETGYRKKGKVRERVLGGDSCRL